MSENSLADYLAESTPADVRARYERLPEIASRLSFGPLDDVVVIDTETTGVSFNHDRLTQIAAARLRFGEIVDWYVTFVNPGKPIPDEIVHLTGITDADVADAPSSDEALERLVEFVGGSPLVAHNANFDKTFCTKDPAGFALGGNVWIDSLDLTRIALPYLKSHRLTDLVHAFGAPESTHRADDDVRALCEVYRILLAGVYAMPHELVSTIARLDSVENWDTAAVFDHFARTGTEDVLEGDPAAGDLLPRDASGEALAFPLPEDAASDGYGYAYPINLRTVRTHRARAVERPQRADALKLVEGDPDALSFPTEEQVAEAFTSEGLVGRLYEGFESRPEQVEMSKSVARAFREGSQLVVEAGTGVGKSMAYLVPAALTAQRNGIGIGVATKTNALLDQLMSHELPALQEALPDLRFASLKGFSHYLCMRRVEELAERAWRQGAGQREVQGSLVNRAPAIATALSFVEQSVYDDIDGLKLDYRAVPRWELTTTSHECLRRKCPYFGTRCFVHGARAHAASADIVVTNHSLLFQDVSADGYLLPPIRHWVIDEAHGAEAEARNALSCEVSARDLENIARSVSYESPTRNVFRKLERALIGSGVEENEASRSLVTDQELKAELEQRDAVQGQRLIEESSGDTLVYALAAKGCRQGAELAALTETLCERIHDLTYFDSPSGSRSYDRVDLWINDQIRQSGHFEALREAVEEYLIKAESVSRTAQGLMLLAENIPHAAAAEREVASCVLMLKEAMSALRTIVVEGGDEFAYSATLVKRGAQPEKLEGLLMDVGDELASRFYSRTLSVVYASATVSIADSFASFTQAVGLGRGEDATYRTIQIPSGYDYDGHMRIYVVEDIAEPNEPAYLDQLSEMLADIHVEQQGSTLTLFTNRREMERCFDAVNPVLQEEGLRLVCQKWGVSVKGLRDDFVNDEHLSLFALKSFWEGFDAPGATLKTVVIPKLPFSRPTDPLSCERASRDRSAWMKYVLPQAIIETRQAAGRLIRSQTDTGTLVLADKRLVTKSYGKTFLKSMPSRSIEFVKRADVARLVSTCFPRG